MDNFAMGVQQSAYEYICNEIIESKENRIAVIKANGDIGIEEICLRLREKWKLLLFSQIVQSERSSEKSKIKTAVAALSQISGAVTGSAAFTTLPLNEVSKIIISELPQTITKYINLEKDINPILKNFRVNKKRRVYKKVKTILFVDKFDVLGDEEKRRLFIVLHLIKHKYIVDVSVILYGKTLSTLPDGILPLPVKTFQLENADLSQKLGKNISLEPHLLEIIRQAGIGFFIEFENIILTTNEMQIRSTDKNIFALINQLMEINIKDAKKENLHSLFRVCSLLVDNFTKNDIEHNVGYVNLSLEYFLEAIDSKLVFENVKDHYCFIADFIKLYYFEQAKIAMSKDTILKIYQYINTVYPREYSFLAELSNIILEENEIISAYSVAFYYYKKMGNSILADRLSRHIDRYGFINDFLTVIVNFESNKNSNLNLENTRKTYNRIVSSQLTVHAKLCMVSLLIPIFTESENDSTRLAGIYRTFNETINQLNDNNCNDVIFWKGEFNRCLIPFSVVVEDTLYTNIRISQKNYDQALQFCSAGVNNDEIHLIRLLILGNAVYPENFTKASQYTKLGYEKSINYPYFHEISRINYSASLLQTGDYLGAYTVLSESPSIKLKEINYDTYISNINNYNVASYLSGNNTIDQSVNLFRQITDYFNEPISSDCQIIMNNLAAFYILKGNFSDSDCLYKRILGLDDLYHQFYAKHNLAYSAMIRGEYELCRKTLDSIEYPYLLKSYSSFFNKKFQLMIQISLQQNKNPDQIEDYLYQYFPQKQYSLYRKPILFGVMERWYE